MSDYIKPRIEILLTELKKNIDLVASKNKDEEWKRDHYRYTFTVSVQRIFNLLNISLTGKETAPVKSSTKKELKELRKILDNIIDE